MDGTIIDIKRFTLHDGDGIRSTLFLKGCPLRCAWCQNPEGLETRLNLWYLENQCVRCRACQTVCPQDALRVGEAEEGPFVRIERAKCTRCGICVETCPTTALTFDGSRISAEEAAEVLLRDAEFYRRSGGGVTISGGDPLLQHEFALEVLERCVRSGVSTAIETCLLGDREVLERFIPLVGLFIVDLKIDDSAMHREYTHQGNEKIKENYSLLAKRGVRLLTRIPMIPAISATETNVRAIARFIASVKGGADVELMNFNPLAVNKYELMNRSTEFFEGMRPLGEMELEELRRILEAEGLHAIREHSRR